MPDQSWVQRVARQTVQGPSFFTFTTAKTVIGQEALLPIGANALKLGDTFSLDVRGGISNIVTTPGTITFQIMMGSIVAWTSGAIQLNATAHTLLPFALNVTLVAQLLNTTVGGVVAKFMGVGTLAGVMFTRTAAQVDQVNIGDSLVVPVTAPALGTAWDSTIGQTMDFFVGMSISNAANGIQIATYNVQWN